MRRFVRATAARAASLAARVLAIAQARPVRDSRPPDNARGGFALVEVLAALVITAIFVAVALPFGVHLVSRWGTGERDVDNADGWMQAIERLSDDVEQAVPIVIVGAGSNTMGFSATSESVKLIRPALGEAAKISLEIVTYAIHPTSAGAALVRSARPFDAGSYDSDPGDQPKSTILDGPFRLKFAIVGKNGRSADGWHDPDMPLRVELMIQGLARVRVPPSPIVLPVTAARLGKAEPASTAQPAGQ